MPLNAYHPLRAVYAFHERAEVWLLRRYAQGVTVDADGEPRLGAYVETRVNLFRDPRWQQSGQGDLGADSGEVCVVYSTTRLRPMDSDDPQAPTYHDVLFDVQGVTGASGAAWCVAVVGAWRDALGYEHKLVRQGQRGSPPWV